MARGTRLLDAYVEVHGDGSRVGPDLARDVQGSTGGARSAGLGWAKALVAGIVGSIAVAKIGGYLKDSVMAGSDLAETISKSTAIFGENQQMIMNWSENAATSMGLSQSAALDAAASFGDMFTQIGFTGDAAADMSKKTVQAAADLGSFSNLETADVVERISAAFRGEYDSLQAVIPNINAARVETEAMAATGKENASELTAQEKAAAVLAIVYQDGSRAMGDFARTSDGLANGLKIASAQSEDLKAKIGTSLTPGVAAFVQVLNEQALPALSLLANQYLPTISDKMQVWADKLLALDLFTFSNGVVTAGDDLQRFLDKFDPLVAIFDAVAPIVVALAAAFAPLREVFTGQLLPILGEFAVILAGALTDAITYITPYVPLLADALVDTLTALVPLIPAILELVPTLLELVPPILDLVTTALPPLVELLGTVLPPAVEILSGALELIGPALQWIVESSNGFYTALGLLIGLLTGDTSMTEYGENITEVGGAFGWLMGVATWFGEQIGAAINSWVAFWTPLQEKVGAVFAFIGSVMGALFAWWQSNVFPVIEALGGLVERVFNFISQLIASVMTTVGSVIGNAWTTIQNTIGNAVNAVVGFISGVWGGLVGLVSGIFNNVVNSGIGAPLAGVMGFFEGLYGNIVGFFGNAGSWLVNAGKNIIDGLIGGIEDALGGLTDLLGSITNMIPATKGPPARDRVLLKENGGLIMQGLLDGLRDETPPVTSYLASLTNNISGTVGANLPTGFGSMDSDKGKAPTFVFEAGSVVIDAKNVKDFTDVVDMIGALPQVARAGAGRTI